MSDQRRILTARLGAGAILLAASLLATAANGAPAGPADTIRVPAGAEVHISGNHVMLGRLGGGGTSDKGGYACECPAGGKGDCTISSTGGNLGCGATTSNGCDKSCVFVVTPSSSTATEGRSRRQAAP